MVSRSSVLGPALLQSRPGSKIARGEGGGRTPHSGRSPQRLVVRELTPGTLPALPSPTHLATPPPGRTLGSHLSGLLRGPSGTQGPRLHVRLRPPTPGDPSAFSGQLGTRQGAWRKPKGPHSQAPISPAPVPCEAAGWPSGPRRGQKASGQSCPCLGGRGPCPCAVLTQVAFCRADIKLLSSFFLFLSRGLSWPRVKQRSELSAVPLLPGPQGNRRPPAPSSRVSTPGRVKSGAGLMPAPGSEAG